MKDWTKWLAGNPIRVWRKKRGVSRELLAVKCSVGYKTIAHWEAWTQEPILENKFQLSEVLEVNMTGEINKWLAKKPKLLLSEERKNEIYKHVTEFSIVIQNGDSSKIAKESCKLWSKTFDVLYGTYEKNGETEELKTTEGNS